MKKMRFLSLMAVLSSLAITGCNQGGSSEEPAPEPVAQVFLLSGQSNMEGNSGWNNNNLKTAFTTLGLEDYDEVAAGMPEVRTTFMGCGYGQLDEKGSGLHASNKSKKLEPKFLDTKPGMGADDNKIGPELGCAYGLRKAGLCTAEAPIYFVKAAFSGSGFAQSGTDWNWKIMESGKSLYQTFVKPYLEKSIAAIEEESGLPVQVNGWLWHQGESDCDPNKIPKYQDNLGELVGALREDFADYAKDGDGANIAFIDGMVYEGKFSGSPKSSWTTPNKMNAEKQKFADSNEMNFLVDLFGNKEQTEENELRPGNPGGDSMHYCTKDSFRLGMAYADVIIENNLAQLFE